MAKNKHSNAGRPTEVTEEIINQLKTAFSYSFTDEEASLYCGISPRTLYNYCSKNPDFAELKEQLKKKPNIKAKMNWIEKMNNKDYQASKEWLERKAKDEFSTKQEVDQNTKHSGEIIVGLPKE